MFWILNLLLLVIVNGENTEETTQTTTPTPTTPTPTTPTPTTTLKVATTIQPFDIDQRLKDILSKYEGDCQGNAELTFYMEQIRFALKLGKEYTNVKTEALANFEAYNKIRMLLDEKIKQRIDTLNDLLPTLTPKSKCSEFYLKQRNILKDIEKLSNADKQARLTENSVNCPVDYDGEDGEEGEDYDFEFDD